jgi:hypothetical protein
LLGVCRMRTLSDAAHDVEAPAAASNKTAPSAKH